MTPGPSSPSCAAGCTDRDCFDPPPGWPTGCWRPYPRSAGSVPQTCYRDGPDSNPCDGPASYPICHGSPTRPPSPSPLSVSPFWTYATPASPQDWAQLPRRFPSSSTSCYYTPVQSGPPLSRRGHSYGWRNPWPWSSGSAATVCKQSGCFSSVGCPDLGSFTTPQPTTWYHLPDFSRRCRFEPLLRGSRDTRID